MFTLKLTGSVRSRLVNLKHQNFAYELEGIRDEKSAVFWGVGDMVFPGAFSFGGNTLPLDPPLDTSQHLRSNGKRY